MRTWDIFCRVIDNYGDIGVCWRLARQLANEYGQEVRLWVDDIAPLTQIWPEAQQLLQRKNNFHQKVAGVQVQRWEKDVDPGVVPADIVIEAFGCEIPESYIATMAARKQSNASIWINLEYLSAENWVDEHHGLTSVHAATGLRKIFFFPGFTERTGGLLRENSLVETRQKFDRDKWLPSLGIPMRAHSLLISLFVYENKQIAKLIEAWSLSVLPVTCLVPDGKIVSSINESIGKELRVGEVTIHGQLSLVRIPFLTQTDYDRLLWACDLNFVRGEDSFVRAQWAEKPFVWHIYPQEEGAHNTKLDAFLDKFLAHFPADVGQDVQDLWQLWNQIQGENIDNPYIDLWNRLVANYASWHSATEKWAQQQRNLDHLANQLMNLVSK